MQKSELMEYLNRIDTDCEVTFLIPESGPPRFVAFNVVTFYTDDDIVVLSIEGDIVETFSTGIELYPNQDV